MSREVLFTHNETLDSSALAQVWYDEISWQLFVGFHNGTIAGYAEVPPAIYEMLIEAPSAGRYYNTSIYGKFTGVDSKDIEFADRYANDVDVQETVVPDLEVSVSGNRQGALSAEESVRMWLGEPNAMAPVESAGPRFYEGGVVSKPAVREYTEDEIVAGFGDLLGDESNSDTILFSGDAIFEDDDESSFTYVVEFDSQVTVHSDVELDTAGVLKAVVESTGGAKVLSITRVFS